MEIGNYTFAFPLFFLMLLLLVPLIVWYIIRNKHLNPTIQISTLAGFKKAPVTYKSYIRHFPFVLRVAVISLLIVVMARPQSSRSWEDVTTEGIDIVLSLDISSSMLAQDFQPNRIEAAKNVAIQFVSSRPLDRMGLVVFSAESFTQCPLTTDHAVLINQIKDTKSGIIEDGTAIGLGLATAVNRLKDSKAISKVIILLTDGMNNRGDIDPVTAADLAESFGIRVYTVGVGTMGMAPYPFQTPFGVQFQNIPVEIDEAGLKKIADQTNGKYFRATDNQKLKSIYTEIDKLEKSKIDVKQHSIRKEEFLIFALIAGALLMLEILLRNTILRNVP
jgi:Ca-activated chloride channel family protein